METKTPLNLHITPHPDYIAQTQLFKENYGLVDIVMVFGESNIKGLKKRKDRICRFCKGDSTKAHFSDRAHLISRFLGNNTLFSDFECDKCNNLFSKYETDLSYYLGIFMSMVEPCRNKKIPTFKSADKSLEIRSVRVGDEDTIIISRESTSNNKIVLDRDAGKITAKFTRHSFVPLNVYKALLKMAMSILDKEEVSKNYKLALEWLMSGHNKDFSGCFVSGYSLPLTFNLPPHIFIFKKIKSEAKMHSHIMAFYFNNLIIALPIPLNKNDIGWYNQGIDIPVYPPLFTQFTNLSSVHVDPFEENLSDDFKVIGSEQQISVVMNPKDVKCTVAFDSKSGNLSVKEFDPGEIMKLIITKSGASFNPPSQLSEVIK